MLMINSLYVNPARIHIVVYCEMRHRNYCYYTVISYQPSLYIYIYKYM